MFMYFISCRIIGVWAHYMYLGWRPCQLISVTFCNDVSAENRACHPGGHYWDYYPGAPSLSEDTYCNSFEDQALIDFIYGYPNLKWDVQTGGHFKNTYELLNPRALKFSPVDKIYIFQCMDKIFCVELQRYPLKFHIKYLTHTLKDMIFIHRNFKNP